MSSAQRPTLLVAGGCADPNLNALVGGCQRAGVEVIDLLFGGEQSPRFAWDLQGDRVCLDGREVSPAGAFVRYNVFADSQASPGVASRAAGWFQSVTGWLLAHPEIRLYNRSMTSAASNKGSQLILARRAGLNVPSTRITNDAGDLGEAAGARIVKPVMGGDFCRRLADVQPEVDLRDGRAAMPAILQEELVAPEIRIYMLRDAAFAFELRSSSLDYREHQDAVVIEVEPPRAEVRRLSTLMNLLGMDFGAADFKSHPQTGALQFLELNTSPMFARFDAECGGRLCDEMIRQLTLQILQRDATRQPVPPEPASW